MTQPKQKVCVWNVPANICERDHIHAPEPKATTSSNPVYSTTQPVTATKKYVPSCRHNRDPIELTDGLTVYASAWSDMPASWWDDRDTKEGDLVPDIGFYLDESWGRGRMWTTGIDGLPVEPLPNSTILYPWDDGGVPADMVHFTEVLTWVSERVKEGKTLDFGCIGGHGRTGTTLTCLAIVLGMRPGAALRHIRKVHCKEAVENSKQVDFIVQFADALLGYDDKDPDDVADNTIVIEERKNCYKESLWKSTPKPTQTPTTTTVYEGGKWVTVDPTSLDPLDTDVGVDPLEDCCGHLESQHDSDNSLSVWWCEGLMDDKTTYCRCSSPPEWARRQGLGDDGISIDDAVDHIVEGIVLDSSCDLDGGECFKAITTCDAKNFCQGVCALAESKRGAGR